MTDNEGKCGKYVGDSDRGGLRPTCVRDFGHGGLCEEDAWVRRHEVIAERDALRAENERLRESESSLARQLGNARVLSTEAAELRASLADAVARMERMEALVNATLKWERELGLERDAFDCQEDLMAAVRDYYKSLPGIVKVGP